MDASSLMSWITFLLSLSTGLLLADPPVKRPAPELLSIDNGTVKIGINKAMGASITHLSWKALAQKNIVNSYDPGRLIQQSYYGGARLDRKKEGQHQGFSPWSWNPIQGGGIGSWARVSRFEKINQGNTLYSETIPKLWDMPNEEAEALMSQWTSFEDGLKNVIVVKNQITCSRKLADRWGPARLNPQEIPALYFTRNFKTFKSYLGKGKWRTEQQPMGPPWGKTTSPRQAMACFEESSPGITRQGIAIFSPSATTWNFGPHGAGHSPDPAAGSCSHIAPVVRVNLGPTSTLSYRYWLIVGLEEELSTTLELLWEKYSKERFTLSNPEK